MEQAIESLPPRFLRHLENIEVVVEKEPTDDELRAAGVKPGGTLLGLYQGIPQGERGSWFGNVLRDRIAIFQRASSLPSSVRERPGG